MSSRLPASERTSQRLRELLSDLPDGEALSEVMKLGMRKIVEEALEAEVSDALGRGCYERGSEPGPDQGKGGKYLFVHRDFKGSIPEGYFVARTPTYRTWPSSARS